MTGHEASRYLQAYCDGELDVAKCLEVEGHLEACPACRRAVEAERLFRAELARKTGREPVPPHLAERVRSALAQVDERGTRAVRPPHWGRSAWAGAVAASLLLMAVGGMLGYFVAKPPARPGLHPVVAALITEHARFARLKNPAELESSSTAQVARWAGEHIGLPVRVPDYSPNGITLLGGRVTRVAGRRVASIVYEKGRSVISLFALPRYGASLAGLEEVRRNGRVFRVGESQGQQILAWDSGEMTYALVSDVGWDELFQCARVFFEMAQS